jgi:alkanesulfonate monooxygenase SsuD/methylene tetrahydromethanopterin reductase-like flavin-dependent oxidoreductase (luciferase family)
MAINPLFNNNQLKLGLFGLNVSNGCAITSAEGSLQTSWPTTRELARIADRDGYETLVPVARWKGFGGETNFNGTNFETYTWAAGLGEATDDICVMTTSHVPTVHPILAAKQGTTIDHITNGRFALNVVCGWFKPELEMFGAPLMDHATRYDYASEWVEIVKRLWTSEDEFDYAGRFFTIEKGFSQPKPLQTPMPPIMNAGGSERGQHFAAKYADMAFLLLQSHDHDQIKRQADAYRELARNEYGREIQLWSYAYVVQAETQKEADDYLRYYVVERGDDVAVGNLTNIMLENAQTLPANIMEQMKFHFKAGWGGYPLVGTADTIAQQLIDLRAQTGLDGMLLSWVDYREGLERFGRDVMPRLEQAGLRRPVRSRAGIA